MRNTWKKTAAFVLAFTLVAAPLSQTAGKDGLFGGTTIIAHAADEVSENISLVASDSSNLKTISGTHYSVSCGYMFACSSGMQVCKSGAMTINARKGETITKVVLTYNWGNNKSSLSASAGTFDGNATISDINAQQVTISSSNTAGVKISAVRVYFEGSLSNPTVTLTGGANAKSSGGLLTQSYLPGAMDTVTYTALTGAAFPEFETYTQNGVTVERTSDTVVTISGTPTANTEITVPDAESSSKIVTWGSSLLNGYDFGNQIYSNNSYSDTANGITLTKSGSGYASLDYGDWMTSGDVTLNFTTATGKFTSIEIEASQILDGGNWTKDGNTLKWNGTPSNSVSLSGSRLYLEGVSSVNFVIEMPADLSTATVTLGADNTVSSVTVGGNEITDLSEFDITYGTDESHTATEPPTEDGTYYAYVTAKTESENYTGTAKSASFEVAAAPTFSNASVTLADDLALNFYVDGIADDTAAAEYTVNFTGACVDESSALTYNAAVGKYYATTHVYAKDINQKITAKLYKGENECGTAQISVADYLTTLAASPDQKTQALALATKLFGDASAAYFNPTETVNDTSVAAEITTYMTQANISDAALTAMAAQYAPNFDSDAAKLSLVLDSKTAARLYVKDDTTGTESTINATKADYPSYHEVAGLLPQNLADEQTITVGGTDYTFSALTWCYRVLNNTNASQKNINMAKAIMAYYEAAKAYTTVDVASVAITNAPTEAIEVGETGTLTANVSPDNATNKTVTWAVTEGEDVLSINAATGAYTALKAGTAKVTATAGGKTAECTITVNAAVTLAGVTLTDGMIVEPHCNVKGEDNWVQFKYVAADDKFVPNFNSYNDVYSKSGGSIMQQLADQWAFSTLEMHETPNGNFYLTQTGNTVHLRADDGINMNVIDLQLDFDNMTYTQLYKQWYNTVSGSFTSIKIGDTTITASQMTTN